MLTGDTGDTVEVDQGTVTVNLATLINAVKGQLAEAGFGLAEQIPEVEASFPLLQSDDLSTIQRVVNLIDGLAVVLVVAVLGLIAAAVLVARDRSRALLAAGLAVAASMLLLGAALNLIRPMYLDALPASSSPSGGRGGIRQLVSFIRFALRGVLVMALAVAVGAWLSSGHGSGAAARRHLGRAFDAARRGREGVGLGTGHAGVVLAEYRGPIRVGLIGAAAVLYLAQDHPTGTTALLFVAATGVLLVVLEVLSSPAGADRASD
ncbi:hypothetical protein [Aeromicrobium sp. UC242_57]|uniref:hypothetical protein n=1 Tax=Aeromicrobium sp. UC242_57 TaxID=3374624 RepID=UPI0037910785